MVYLLRRAIDTYSVDLTSPLPPVAYSLLQIVVTVP
jgi:hypothetical protein